MSLIGSLFDENYFTSIATHFFTCSDTQNPPWLGASLNGGTTTVREGERNHPGIVSLVSSGVYANAGYRFVTEPTSFLLGGGEESFFKFKFTNFAPGAVIDMGFQDGFPGITDGVWLSVNNTDICGKTQNGNGPSNTDYYTLSLATWYMGRIVLNADATRVDFYLYNESGTELWTKYLTTNIPTGAGRWTGHGIVAIRTDSVGMNLIDIDYMSIHCSRKLV
jgi:hypothetical protein